MKWELRHIRTLIAIAEQGSLTDAAIELGISQAQVSRTLKSLEDAWGILLVRRRAGHAALTAAGQRAVVQGRHLLQMAQRMEAEAKGQSILRLGYTWAAAGRHTPVLQRVWHQTYPEGDLLLVRGEGPLAGLAEGLVDAAIVRTEPDSVKFPSVLVGTERRVCCLAEDHPWVTRGTLAMDDFADEPLILDSRTGTTSPDLWPSGSQPRQVLDVDSVDAWLDAIASGRGLGVSSEATAHQHQRSGVVYRPITDAPPLGVWLAWHRGEDSMPLAALRSILADLYSARY